MVSEHTPLLEVRGLHVAFRVRGGAVEAVRGVDLTLEKGQVLGIVGESGSGKSVAMLAVMGLLPPVARVTGSVRFHGREIRGLPPRELQALRGKRVAMIFQDPLTALNPVVTVGKQIAEMIRLHDRGVSKKDAIGRAIELLGLVSTPQPDQRVHQYPHEFSGGMRQRVMIAMAVANEPELLIADEPTTALDVTVQAQILEVLARLRETLGIGLVLITHDLGVVAGTADSVSVMYSGRVVERGAVDDLFYGCRHPYTRGLLASLPKLDRSTDRLVSIEGTPPSLAKRPSGCAFRPRCPSAGDRCRNEDPMLRPISRLQVACHFAETLDVEVAQQPVAGSDQVTRNRAGRS
ncbi:MAG: ABC transporter ATP-binding protein [Planctomycetota bacterium]|jgi:oligopeptide/dipeptide ABC transporter ATP-binding protein